MPQPPLSIDVKGRVQMKGKPRARTSRRARRIAGPRLSVANGSGVTRRNGKLSKLRKMKTTSKIKRAKAGTRRPGRYMPSGRRRVRALATACRHWKMSK